MLLMMIIIINNSNGNNSDSNSIFSSSIRDHSGQWKEKHLRYILATIISWTPMLSEKQHVCYHAVVIKISSA